MHSNIFRRLRFHGQHPVEHLKGRLQALSVLPPAKKAGAVQQHLHAGQKALLPNPQIIAFGDAVFFDLFPDKIQNFLIVPHQFHQTSPHFHGTTSC